jgi:ERCC4-type nuclease
MDQLKIIIDTREQKPWEFPGHTTAVQKLDTGDYSVEGLEDILCIERKQNTSEFAKNIVEKRYDDWTERMSKFKYKFLLLEFSLSDVYLFPKNSGIPKHMLNKTRISSKFLIKKLIELSMLHDIHVLFCESSYTASKFAEAIMYKVYSNEREQ